MTLLPTKQKRGENIPVRHIPLPLDKTKDVFSSFFLDYLAQKKELAPYYHRFPTLPAFEQQVAEKQRAFPTDVRQALHRTLTRQYKDLTRQDVVNRNLKALADNNTFTVTTGHQLNIFTGPLYIIYKIVSTINLCKKLQREYPHYRFVPIYWMASEDHDFKEISQFTLYGKTYMWQTAQQGRVGRFDTAEMRELLDRIPGDTTPFSTAYLSHRSLSDAVRYYMNELFGHEGLITIDADCRELKTFLRPVIADDLFLHIAHTCVTQNDQKLKQTGYNPQINTRPVNFFYVENDIRERIERNENMFSVLGTDFRFNSSQLQQLVDQNPEKFSPNVSLRPLYQELILPNIAYVGGPAETVYWLQLKPLFDHYNTPFPILVPRNFALIVDGPTARAWDKTTLDPTDIFKTNTQLHAQWVRDHTDNTLTLETEKNTMATLLQEIEKKAARIDPTLQRMVRAEAHNTQRGLGKIEHRMLRAEKRKYCKTLRQIDNVKTTLFPGGNLQERTENFLTFYQTDPQFIQKLLHTFDPLDFRFHMLLYPFT